MPACEAYSGSDDARIGFFDDCFLVSNDDSGTFRTDADRDYMAADARFTPMTGETCGLNVTLTNCTNALYRLVEENWDLLNYGYNLDVLGGWLTEGCYDTIRDRLGYRFEFKATSGNLSVTNVGFGNVYNMYGVRFLLVPTSLANGATSGQGYVQEVNFDIRNGGQIPQWNLPSPTRQIKIISSCWTFTTRTTTSSTSLIIAFCSPMQRASILG